MSHAETPALIAAQGFGCQRHEVLTSDGYILGLHRVSRLCLTGSPEISPEACPESPSPCPPVLLLHGLMMSDEIFVCRRDALAFHLCALGYDVWLGNMRGNAYSQRHRDLSTQDDRFWQYSLDEVVQYDVPALIDYILMETDRAALSLIGFSHGAAAGLAMLSSNPELGPKIDIFIALAPATSAKGFSNIWLNSLAKTAPQFVYWLFGRKQMLPFVARLQSALEGTRLWRFLLDWTIWLLFGWKMDNVCPYEKTVYYEHLFNWTSVQSIVHWFQILDAGEFCKFRMDANAVPVVYPLHSIAKNMVVFYGGLDCLPDNEYLLKHLPTHAEVICVKNYEHLDFLMARNADQAIYEPIAQRLKTFYMNKQTST